jgi:hypothetical protein
VAQAGVAPVLVTSVPAADSAGFAIDANLTLTFSQRLDAATVTPENIQLTEGEFAIQCTATLAGHVVDHDYDRAGHDGAIKRIMLA